MKQNFKKAGRHPKINPTVFRCSVNFNASEHIALQAMHEKSGVDSLSAFIKMQLFGKPFKVFSIDTNTRILEQVTIDLVKTNREIVAIANRFDAYWRRDSND